MIPVFSCFYSIYIFCFVSRDLLDHIIISGQMHNSLQIQKQGQFVIIQSINSSQIFLIAKYNNGIPTLLCRFSNCKLAVQSKVGVQRLAQLGYINVHQWDVYPYPCSVINGTVVNQIYSYF